MNRNFWTMGQSAALGCCLFFAGAARADTLTAAADTTVQFGSPDANFGTNSTVIVKNTGATIDGTDRIGYLRFDLASLARPEAGSGINRFTNAASLMLNITSGGTTGFNFTLFGIPNNATQAGRQGEDFIETTLTYNNAFGTDTSANNVNDAAFTDLGSVSIATGSTQLTFNDARLLDFLNADTNDIASFVIVRNSTSTTGTSFASKENTTVAGPQLTVTPVPEPATMTLLLLGLSGTAASRLRRKRTTPATPRI